MKTIRLLFFTLLFTTWATAQQSEIVPDLSKVKDTTLWNLDDRELLNDDPVHLSRGEGDGILWLKDLNFENGRIEFDVKGKDKRGESFVGLAFHGFDKNNFELIYFRPFNFKSEEKKNNALQYVSLPDFTWQKLRKEHPGVYENAVSPVPDPNAWVHAKIVIDYPTVSFFVENSDVPSLTIEQLSDRKKGWIGFWVGSNSEGEFKNLRITKN
jgi:hypothetical protein